MKKHITLFVALMMLATQSLSVANNNEVKNPFEDQYGEHPYEVVTQVNGSWAFGLFGDVNVGFNPNGVVDFFAELGLAIAEIHHDAQKYTNGQRFDHYSYSLYTVSCVENSYYDHEGMDLSAADKAEALIQCKSYLKDLQAQVDNVALDYLTLDPSTESVIVEAFQDTIRDINMVITGREVSPLDKDTHYYWQNVMAEGLLKVGAGSLKLIQTPFKVAYGAALGTAGLVVFPFERKGHMGDTARSGFGYALKSAMDPFAATLVIVEGFGGPIIYAATTAAGPIVIAVKEGHSIFHEAHKTLSAAWNDTLNQ